MDEIRLTDLSYLRDLMSRHGVYTKKKFGQNFLINPSVPARIAECGCPGADYGVLEIGPGAGTLTRALAHRAGKVVCLEIDRSLEPVLNETLRDLDNVRVIFEDVLKTDLRALCQEEFSGCQGVCVCANLPYYVTTPVLMYLLESGVRFDCVTVMVQKEVAQRITAPAGSPEYGAITADTAIFGTAERLFTVLPGSFYPAPKVESSVMRIRMYQTDPYADCDKKLLRLLVKTAFGQRRKTLINTYKSVLNGEELKIVASVLQKAGFQADVRGEKLDISDFAAICRALQSRD